MVNSGNSCFGMSTKPKIPNPTSTVITSNVIWHGPFDHSVFTFSHNARTLMPSLIFW